MGQKLNILETSLFENNLKLKRKIYKFTLETFYLRIILKIICLDFQILKITFTSFSLESSVVCFDSLTIYQKTSSLHQIGKWCGNKKPNDIFVKGPEILIRFNSDQRIERRGFRLHYSITKQHSQGNFDILMVTREKAANTSQF